VTSLEKPSYLGPEFAEQFCDVSIVRAYGTRPPYPAELFEKLASLVAGAPRIVLELGCGSGDLTHRLAPLVGRVDAVDSSEPMLESALALRRSSNICFVHASAEEFVAQEHYALAVAAESLHWMEWSVVMPKLKRCLRPQAVLAIVTPRVLRGLPWLAQLELLITRYSTNRAYRRYDLVEELRGRGMFQELGRATFRAPFRQGVDAYVESFHSRNGFSRDRMQAEDAQSFDRGVRALVLEHRPDGEVEAEVEATIVWGQPLGAQPAQSR
jgi:trans-aconitate methyltransferase